MKGIPIMKKLVALSVIAATVVATAPAIAAPPVIEGNIYYFTTAETISANISGNDIIIGRTPGGTFANAAGDTNITTPYTVTVDAGTQVTQNVPNDGYNGLMIFGAANVNIIGGNVVSANTFTGSTLNVSGGTSVLLANNGGTLDVSGGNTDTVSARGGITRITGGTQAEINASDAAVDIYGGTVTDTTSGISLSIGGVANFYGTNLSANYIGFANTADRFNITGFFGGSPTQTSYLVSVQNRTGTGNPTPRQFTLNNVTVVPEASSLALFVLPSLVGAVRLATKARHRSAKTAA